ncbi:MAG: (2Fe-2S)-binding protein [Nitrospinae bacterium]|nr:(2Fe-2S)-binding protein [Nitrospinota bacterium]MZH42367.1 (2Fe-2S)-binding protein [Nitrospinota bacterium]MZH45861.1 (2Fe-2S)-binding protein [Nitrospinota bacterium]
MLETKKQFLDNLKKVCLCRSIKAGTIMAAIKGGTLTFEGLRKELGVGTGNCKAKRCRSKIEERIKEYKDSLKEDGETVEP